CAAATTARARPIAASLIFVFTSAFFLLPFSFFLLLLPSQVFSFQFSVLTLRFPSRVHVRHDPIVVSEADPIAADVAGAGHRHHERRLAPRCEHRRANRGALARQKASIAIE